MANPASMPTGGSSGNPLNDILPDNQIPPNRNILYRRRKVILEVFYLIPTTFVSVPDGTGIKFVPKENTVKSTKVIELTEVTSFNIQSANSTAIGLGPVEAVIQPWYFQPFKIEIGGKSYMGAFSTSRLNIGVDKDIAALLDVRDIINQQFKNGLGDKVSANLLCFDSNDSNSRSVSQEYTGFLDDISINESQDLPFMMSYTIRFVGEIKAEADILSGGRGNYDDRGVIAKTTGAVTGYVSKALGL